MIKYLVYFCTAFESSLQAKFGLVVQLVRMPACHAGGREFESRPDRYNIIQNTDSHLFTGGYFYLHSFLHAVLRFYPAVFIRLFVKFPEIVKIRKS